MPFVTEPWFYALAIPAVLITRIRKGGFAGGAGNMMMALVVPAPVGAYLGIRLRKRAPMRCSASCSTVCLWWRA